MPEPVILLVTTHPPLPWPRDFRYVASSLAAGGYDVLELESGADAARLVLDAYHPDTDSWDQPQTGEFWDAVAAAHSQGSDGRGRRIAVIDAGFDLALPALAAQHEVWPTRDGVPTSHGTAVALLVHRVAPGATLDLYPVGTPTGLADEAVGHAIRLAGISGADVINLSLGEPLSLPSTFDHFRQFVDADLWADVESDDMPFLVADALAADPDWRHLFPAPPESDLLRAIDTALAPGATVVAAAGNDAAEVFTPGIHPGVLAASHLRVDRFSPPGDGELAQAVKPFGYSQSRYSDFAIVQPPHTLGSSFAAPLVSGFAALLPDRANLPRHRVSVRLASLAGELIPLLTGDAPGRSERREGVLERLYTAAINASPHQHFRLDDLHECPECALFAAPAYIDGGLFFLKTGNLDSAQTLLTAAVVFAPRNPHAKANLAMTYAMRAEVSRVSGDREQMVSYLARADAGMREAHALLPDRVDIAARVEEFTAARRSPDTWRFARSTPTDDRPPGPGEG